MSPRFAFTVYAFWVVVMTVFGVFIYLWGGPVFGTLFWVVFGIGYGVTWLFAVATGWDWFSSRKAAREIPGRDY